MVLAKLFSKIDLSISNMKKFILAVILLVALLCSGLTVKAMTESEYLSSVAQIKKKIAELTLQLTNIRDQYAADEAWCHTFNNDLRAGNEDTDTSGEITFLQMALVKEGFSIKGDVQGVFGKGTTSAVVSFQNKYASEVLTPFKLRRGTGYVGKSTRDKLNNLYGCSVSQTCTPNWSCADWSACSNGSQNRTCSDSNNCGSVTGKPAITQACIISTQPSLTITSPNGGETWKIGETYDVTWQANAVDLVYPIWYGYDSSGSIVNSYPLYSINNGTAIGISAKLGKISWTIPSAMAVNPSLAKSKISISSAIVGGISDASDNYFSISSSSTTCTPNWSCADWSACSNGSQNRTCSDSNNCGSVTGKPATTQACGASPKITLFTLKAVDGTEPRTWPYISPLYSLTVPYNTAATISWTSSGATSCTASGDWSGSKATSGSESTGVIALSASEIEKTNIIKKFYKLTCNSTTGETVSSSTIQVVSIQPNIYLRANDTPTTITVPYNTPVTLSWGAGPSRATNGQLFYPTSCNLGLKGYGGSSVAFSGSKSIGNVTSNATYSLGCIYPNDWIDAPSCNQGERCCTRQLSTSFDVGNGSGVKVEGDNIVNCLEGVNPTNGQYTVGKSINIDIVVAKPTVSIVADSSNVAYNGAVKLTWTSSGATSCTASGDWSGDKTGSGSEVISALKPTPKSYKNYTITCKNPSGQTSATATVHVSNP